MYKLGDYVQLTVETLLEMLRRETETDMSYTTYITESQIRTSDGSDIVTKSYLDGMMAKELEPVMKQAAEAGRIMGENISKQMDNFFGSNISMLCQVCRRKYHTQPRNVLVFTKKHGEDCPANDWFIEESKKTGEGQLND